jgi:hypothetical protein
MSEKYFVVSESELLYLARTASDIETGDCSMLSYETAKTACRARPVVEVASGVYENEEWYK